MKRTNRDIKPRILPGTRAKAPVPAGSPPAPTAKPVGGAELRRDKFASHTPSEHESGDDDEPVGRTRAADTSDPGQSRTLSSPPPVIEDDDRASGVPPQEPDNDDDEDAPAASAPPVEEKYLPDCLRADGVLAGRVAVAGDGGAHPELVARVEATRVRLREEVGRAVYSSARPYSDALDRVVRADRGDRGPRALDVVTLAWAHLELKVPIPPDLEGAAFAAFRERRAAYEAVLGDSLGGGFLDAFDAHCSAAGLYSVADEMGVRRRHLAARGSAPPAPSGYAELDRLTGGLAGYVLVSGNPATDPGALALNLAYRALVADRTAAALVVPLARPKGEVLDRLLAIATGLPAAAAPDLGDAETGRAYDRAADSEVLSRMDLLGRSGDEPSYDLRAWFGRIVRRAEKLVKRTGAGRLVVVIDPLHEVTFAPQDRSPTTKSSDMHYFTEPELDRLRVHLVRELLSATSSLNPGVLAVNKPTKVAAGRRMGLDDVYGGVDLIYPAATVLLLNSDDRPEAAGGVPHVLGVAKADGGTTGDVPLLYRPATHTFAPRDAVAGEAAQAGGLFNAPERSGGKRRAKQ